MKKSQITKIELNSNWAIGFDKYNIILFHKIKKVDKEPIWEIEGFYATLHNVLTGLVNKEVRDTELKSLKELTSKLDQIYGLIKKMPQIMVNDLRR